MEMKAGTRSGLLTLRFLQVNGEAERVAEFIIVGPQFWFESRGRLLKVEQVVGEWVGMDSKLCFLFR